MQTITPARSYRATVIPADFEATDVEDHAARGLLPTVQFRASTNERAVLAAQWLTARRVLRCDRVERAQGVAA